MHSSTDIDVQLNISPSINNQTIKTIMTLSQPDDTIPLLPPPQTPIVLPTTTTTTTTPRHHPRTPPSPPPPPFSSSSADPNTSAPPPPPDSYNHHHHQQQHARSSEEEEAYLNALSAWAEEKLYMEPLSDKGVLVGFYGRETMRERIKSLPEPPSLRMGLRRGGKEREADDGRDGEGKRRSRRSSFGRWLSGNGGGSKSGSGSGSGRKRVE